MQEKPSKSNYPDLSDEALKQIAVDYRAGRIFTDRDVHSPEDVGMVFMPFLFMDKNGIQKLKEDPPGLVYEYMSQAGYRSVNGMPVFMSAHMLSKSQTARVLGFVKALEAAEKAVKL